jgi:hypothetical protein
VGETDIVATEFFCPTEKGIDILLGVGAAGAVGGLGVNGDTAEEDGFAVEKNLSASGFDGAEADLVFDFVGIWAGCSGYFYFVEFGIFG